jgi:hypothetical protein
MKKVGSSLSLFTAKLKGTNEVIQPERHHDEHDRPCPPPPTADTEVHLKQLEHTFSSAFDEVNKARKEILNRRSNLFESVDSVLLVLKLLPQELQNVQNCVSQALSWNFLTDESKQAFETNVASVCHEISFALPHLAITERNESLDAQHSTKLTYRATAAEYTEWHKLVVNAKDDESIKAAIREVLPLEPMLQSAVEGAETCLRNLTKIRVRYKMLLYQAMGQQLVVDEREKKGGVTMSALLHPYWN